MMGARGVSGGPAPPDEGRAAQPQGQQQHRAGFRHRRIGPVPDVAVTHEPDAKAVAGVVGPERSSAKLEVPGRLVRFGDSTGPVGAPDDVAEVVGLDRGWLGAVRIHGREAEVHVIHVTELAALAARIVAGRHRIVHRGRQAPVAPGHVADTIVELEVLSERVRICPVEQSGGAVSAGERVLRVLQPGYVLYVVVDQPAAAIDECSLARANSQQAQGDRFDDKFRATRLWQVLPR
jgi:hypothetical protein